VVANGERLNVTPASRSTGRGVAGALWAGRPLKPLAKAEEIADMGAAWAQHGPGPTPRRKRRCHMEIVITLDLEQPAIALAILLSLR
jgi:hypothetical protein